MSIWIGDLEYNGSHEDKHEDKHEFKFFLINNSNPKSELDSPSAFNIMMKKDLIIEPHSGDTQELVPKDASLSLDLKEGGTLVLHFFATITWFERRWNFSTTYL